MGKIDSIKKFFGLERFTKYTSEYFDRSNIRSSLYVASVVVVLEIWMILSTLFLQFFGNLNRSKSWLITHITSYSILLISAAALLIFSILHVKKIIKHKKGWCAVRFVFFNCITRVWNLYFLPGLSKR